MKNIIFGIATIAMTVLPIAAPAGAQQAPQPTRSYNADVQPQPQPGGQPGTQQPGGNRCYGTLCSGQSQTATVVGGVIRSGTAGAGFDVGEHGQGESGVASAGTGSVDFKLNFSTCAQASCAENGIQGTVMGNQNDQGYAFGTSTQSNRPIFASTAGASAVVMDFGVGVDACPGGCSAVTTTAPK